MEDRELKKDDLKVDSLGMPKIPSPLGMGSAGSDGEADYMRENRTVLFDTDRDTLLAAVREGTEVPAFEMAGPRRTIFFDPAKVKAAIVTCGGLCPG
ncbi:MAG: ATP-dependent 6-phosphofructokinase, partial [Spirochaetia bacterium]